MINDSAGIEVPLTDKSERASTALGFRSAAVIEAARGLCEQPVLITSEKDYVKTFGAPAADKYGAASVEAYLLAQSGVPQVIVRAKNQALEPNARPFPVIMVEGEGADAEPSLMKSNAASEIAAPTDSGKVNLFFKGEGVYAATGNTDAKHNASNVVLRFSKPADESAYAEAKRVVHLQVFDFAGAKHIDTDQKGKLLFNPAFSDVFDGDGSFSAPLTALLGENCTAQIAKYTVTAFVNGRPGTAVFGTDASSDAESSGSDMWAAIGDAIAAATKRDGTAVLPAGSWGLVADEGVTGSSDKYVSTENDGKINAFELSISIAIEAELSVSAASDIASFYANVDAGTVTIRDNVAKIALNSSVSLIDRDQYMFMGEANSYWAAFYEGYSKESWDFSFSYDDYDANYVSLQADAVLKASNYVVCKSSDDGIPDYAIDWDSTTGLAGKLQYFECEGAVTPNDIPVAQKSFAYATALSKLLADNLTTWRCLCAPNLGDVMIKGDYVAAIDSAAECALGVSNIGRAASTDALGNLNGRHGNRFIADYSVYGYRNINGRRTPITLACLMAERLNKNFNNGNEARPPFGPTYGEIACNEISQTMTGAERLMLARQYKVNPVIEDGGFFAWDERTSQQKETSLSDIHTILSFIWMKFQIYDTMKSFIAEYNDQATVNRGLSLLDDLRLSWISKNYVEEAMVNADKNVIGDETMRFSVAVRFKGVARYIVVDVTAYSQTQSLAISLAQEV